MRRFVQVNRLPRISTWVTTPVQPLPNRYNLSDLLNLEKKKSCEPPALECGRAR